MAWQPLKLVQEVDIRGHSTHDMLQRLLDLQEPVGAALASLSSDVMPIAGANFEIIQQSLDVRNPWHLEGSPSNFSGMATGMRGGAVTLTLSCCSLSVSC